MLNGYKRLFAILKIAGINPKMTRLRDRIKIQKIVYLLKSAGLVKNIEFNWYLYGPYSSELTTTIYKVIEDPKRANSNKKFDLPEDKIVKFVDRIFERSKSPYELELLASLQYIKDKFDSYGNDPHEVKESIIDSLILMKPKFSRKHIEESWDKLEVAFKEL